MIMKQVLLRFNVLLSWGVKVESREKLLVVGIFYDPPSVTFSPHD